MHDLFLLDPSITFLNHGSFGACPRAVFEIYQDWQRALELQPVAFLGRHYDSLIQQTAEKVGLYLGTGAENLVFVPNATHGLTIVGRSLKLQAGDEILMTDHEYGALVLMWDYLARETGIKIIVRKLPKPLVDPHAVAEHFWGGVTARTRLIFMSHITSITALILPVEEICRRAREAGILTMIDGAHVPGHIPLDLEALGADFYSGNFHKWLCAPKGSAFLYVRPEHHSMIDPLVISWGWDGDSLFERTRWQGTLDPAAYLTVPAAIEFQAQHDWETVRTRSKNLARDTMLRLCSLFGLAPLAMPRFFGQMAVAPLPECNPTDVKERLYNDYKIEIPLTALDGQDYIRFSFQAYNSQADADKLVQALSQIFEREESEVPSSE